MWDIQFGIFKEKVTQFIIEDKSLLSKLSMIWINK